MMRGIRPKHGGHVLVDHESADLNLFSFEFLLLDELVLLVEVGDKFRAVVTAVTFSSEDESVSTKSGTQVKRAKESTYSLDSYLWNSGLSNKIWNACQIGGAAANVLFTLIVPKEKPVPMGWSM